MKKNRPHCANRFAKQGSKPTLADDHERAMASILIKMDNASSTCEPSLKFDVRIAGWPAETASHQIAHNDHVWYRDLVPKTCNKTPSRKSCVVQGWDAVPTLLAACCRSVCGYFHEKQPVPLASFFSSSRIDGLVNLRLKH